MRSKYYFIKDKSYLHNYVKSISIVDITVPNIEKMSGYSDLLFYFEKLRLSKIFQIPRTCHMPDNNLNAFYFSSMAFISIPASYYMDKDIILGK